MPAIGWNFPENNYGQDDGISDAGIETFSDKPFASLAREIIQNSLDAVDKAAGKPVHVKFSGIEHRSKDIPGYDDLIYAHEQSRRYWLGNRKAENFFDGSLRMLNSDRLFSLRISDYNTTGLKGATKGKGQDWYNLIKSAGASDKGEVAGGSFGIGKNAPFACSALRTILYRTLDVEGVYAFQGVSKLVTHENKDGKPTRGQGYYGHTEKNTPLLGEEVVDIFDEGHRDRSGTDVYVIGVGDMYIGEWKDRVVRAVLENFFVSIHNGHLVVEVDDILITQESIGRCIEEILKDDDDPCWAEMYYDAITSDDRHHFIEDDMMGLGTVELFLLPDSKAPKRVAMVRDTGMKVYDKGHFRTPVKFAGVFIAKGAKLNEVLRELEPPKHDNWIADRHPNDPDYAKSVIRSIYQWINDNVRELAAHEYSEEIDVEELSRYLPDDWEEGTEDSPEEQERTEEPLPEIEVNMRPPRTSPPETQFRSIDGNGEEGIYEGEGEEGIGPGDPDAPNEGTGGVPPEGGGALNDGGGTGGSGTGGQGPERVGGRRKVSLRNVRAFSSDSDHLSVYELMFEPETDGSLCIEVTVAGESGLERASVNSARMLGTGQELDITDRGEIRLGDVAASQKVRLEVTLQGDERRALEVAAHAN